MKIYKNYLLIPFLLLFIVLACEEDNHAPVSLGGGAPSPVSGLVLESMPGAAKISYRLPSDKNLLYVKARYEIRPGVPREIKSSFYSSNLVVDGFGDTTEYRVDLVSVGRNSLESDPVTITVKPLRAPIFDVYESIVNSISETFGGIKFNVENPSEAEVRIYVTTTDSLGEWVDAETFYTSAATGAFSVRGYDSISRPFGIYIKDRWDNKSETYENLFHPWYEQKLDKTKFRQIDLPTDQNKPHMAGRTLSRIWDEDYSNNDFVTTVGYGIPQWFTFDLGVRANLSRIVVYNRSSGATYIYNAGSVKEWEIFGSESPNPDGSWDESWKPLRSQPCVSWKPSGLPLGEYNNEDIQRQIDGEEFEFDALDSPVRYLRWKTNAVWGGSSIGHINLVEITLYGSVVE